MNLAIPRLVLVAVAGLLLTGAVLPQLRVEVRADKLSVQADGAPLYGVLWAISAQTGIQLDLKGGLGSADTPVTEDFKDVPLDQGITQLLQNYLRPPRFALVIDKRTGAVEAIQVLGVAAAGPRSRGSSAESTASTAAKRGSAEGADAVGLTDAQREYLETARAESYEAATEALEAARSASDLESQTKAIRSLGSFQQDQRILEVLRPALKSRAPEVRTAALEAMRFAYVNDPGALADARSLTVNDPVPAVRQAAFEVLIRDKSPEAQALLAKLAAEQRGAFAARARKELDLRSR